MMTPAAPNVTSCLVRKRWHWTEALPLFITLSRSFKLKPEPDFPGVSPLYSETCLDTPPRLQHAKGSATV